MNTWRSYLRILGHMLHVDWLVLKKNVHHITINSSIWSIVTTTCAGRIAPAMGVDSTFVAVLVGGIIASCISMPIYPHAMTFASDLNGDRKINFLLTLPIPRWLVAARTAIAFFMNQLIISVVAITCIRLVLWDCFNFAHVQWGAFAIMLLAANAVCAAAALCVATFFSNSPISASTIWMRFLFPLWFFGGYQNTWPTLYRLWPKAALLGLLNPYTYLMEGIRGTVLGGRDSLPWPLCLVVLGALAIGMIALGSYRLKKKLDAV